MESRDRPASSAPERVHELLPRVDLAYQSPWVDEGRVKKDVTHSQLHARRIDDWKHLPLYSHRYQDSPIVCPYSPCSQCIVFSSSSCGLCLCLQIGTCSGRSQRRWGVPTSLGKTQRLGCRSKCICKCPCTNGFYKRAIPRSVGSSSASASGYGTAACVPRSRTRRGLARPIGKQTTPSS
jgi:hypothetical protein